MPIPDKPKHRKHKSQVYEGNGPIRLDSSSNAYNITHFENLTRSTEQSYQPLNTLTVKNAAGAASKRTSVIHEGKSDSLFV